MYYLISSSFFFSLSLSLSLVKIYFVDSLIINEY